MKQLTLKRARRRKGFTLSGLARAADLNRMTVDRLERGVTSPNWQTVQALEDALDLEPGSLRFDRKRRAQGAAA